MPVLPVKQPLHFLQNRFVSVAVIAIDVSICFTLTRREKDAVGALVGGSSNSLLTELAKATTLPREKPEMLT